MATLSPISERHMPAAASTAHRATICQVLHSLNVGGAEMLAARIARNMQEHYRFVFACLDELGSLGEQLQAEGFVVEVMNRGPGFDLGCVRRLADFVYREHVDLIHAHQYTPFFYARAPGVLRRRPPVLFNEHGRFHPDRPSRKRMAFNRLALRGTDRVVSVGGAVRQALVENEGISAQRIEVVYNGVELGAGNHSQTIRAAMRSKLGLADDDFVVIQVARLDPIKDHSTALRAMEQVAQTHRQARLLIVGDGPQREQIQQELANHKGLAGVVQLLGQRSDIAELLAASDLFLLTSLSEGIPVTFIEAMGASLPIVSTDVGGVAEVVNHGATGLLTPAADEAALAEAIRRMIDNPAECQAMGVEGRRRAEARFSERQMHEAYSRLYEEMLSG
jgi:L-malate glycosyltransferase